MKRPPCTVAHSVRARLLTLAKAGGEEFTYALTRFGLERLLARVAASSHVDSFVLKGAMLFRVWAPTLHRPTKDLDLLGRGSPELGRLAQIFAEICQVVIEDDGLAFDPKSVRAARIKEDAPLSAQRLERSGNARRVITWSCNGHIRGGLSGQSMLSPCRARTTAA